MIQAFKNKISLNFNFLIKNLLVFNYNKFFKHLPKINFIQYLFFFILFY